MQLNHFNIKADRDTLEQVKQFYCEGLGMRVGPRPTMTTYGYWLYAGDSALVHLEEAAEPRQGVANPYLDHIAFQVQGAQAYVARFEGQQIAYTRNYVADIQLTQLFTHDPVGNRLELNFPGERL